MVYTILDKNLAQTYVIDAFESMLWTLRFGEYGEFELITSATTELINEFKIDYYIFCDLFYDITKDEAQLMIIETLNIDSSVEDGAKLIVKGRSLESILDRRALYFYNVNNAYVYSQGTASWKVVYDMVYRCIISPWSLYMDNTGRDITNFKWENPSSGSKWTNLVIDTEFQSQNLYDAIKDICERYHMGFKIVYNFTTNQFIMRMIEPVDHTYEQTAVIPVVFSPGFGNLLNSNYLNSKADFKNMAFIHGANYEWDSADGNTHYSMPTWNTYKAATYEDGLYRRELLVEASDISWKDENDNERSTTTYNNLMIAKATQEVNLHGEIKTYDAEADLTQGFTYQEDYNIGDIVEVINEFDISAQVIISEIVLSEDVNNGFSVVPTFKERSEEVITT